MCSFMMRLLLLVFCTIAVHVVAKTIEESAYDHAIWPTLDDNTDLIDAIERLNMHDRNSRSGTLNDTDEIRFGFTSTSTAGSAQTPFAVRAVMAYRTWAQAVNDRGGLLVNGTRHKVKLIWYNDGDDCATMQILYERLIYTDLVHVLFAPVTYRCENVAITAQNAISPITGKYVPFINAADYTLPILMDNPTSVYSNLTSTRNIVSNYWTSGTACIDAAYRAGARTYLGYYNVEIPDYVPQGYLAAQQRNMTMLQNITIVSLADIASTPQNSCVYYDPYIDLWQSLDPDMVFGTASVNSTYFIRCMLRKQWRPRAFWAVSSLWSASDPNAWMGYGTMRTSIWRSISAGGGSLTDPLFGNISNFVNIFAKTWNVTGDIGYQATIATSGTIVGLAIERANSIDPDAILAQLDAINDETLLGTLRFLPEKPFHLDRPYLCIQQLNSTTSFNLVYSPVDTNAQLELIYPWNLVYEQWFLDSLVEPNKGLKRRNVILIAVFCSVFPAMAIIIVLGWIILRTKYTTVFVPKTDVRSDNWDDNSSQRAAIGRVLPCLKLQ